MRVLIVDDEPPARERLRSLLAEIPGCAVVGEAATGAEALAAVAQAAPDVVLLDIRMPGMDGLEAARHLARLDSPPAVVFTTAYDQHALAAFEAQARDYLLKPVRRERLEQSLAAARSLNRAQLEALQRAGAEAARSHVSANVRGRLQLVAVREVAAFKADQKYVSVLHAGGELLIEDSLVSLEQEFGVRFLRIHRNALVCPDFLEALEKTPSGQCRVRMRGVRETLEVSRRHLPELRRLLKGL